jgi:hypothetical protein
MGIINRHKQKAQQALYSLQRLAPKEKRGRLAEAKRPPEFTCVGIQKHQNLIEAP